MKNEIATSWIIAVGAITLLGLVSVITAASADCTHATASSDSVTYAYRNATTMHQDASGRYVVYLRGTVRVAGEGTVTQ
jgi:hypothetical protein